MTQQVEALLTEHFRYTPLVHLPSRAGLEISADIKQSLIDDIINTVNTIIYRAVEAIENGLFSIPPQQLGYSPEKDSSGKNTSMIDMNHPEAKDEIENGVHQLETLLEATVDKTFDKFEIYTLRNILTVPDELAPWMRLGHYEVYLSLKLMPRTFVAFTLSNAIIALVLIATQNAIGSHAPPPSQQPNPRINPRSPA